MGAILTLSEASIFFSKKWPVENISAIYIFNQSKGFYNPLIAVADILKNAGYITILCGQLFYSKRDP